MRGIRDWGLGIRKPLAASQRTAWVPLLACPAVLLGDYLHALLGEPAVAPALARPLSNPQSPIPNPSHPSRRAITLIEVLVSIAILAIGVLGVAALLPIGKLSLIKTEIADRTGACGRAALREVKVRRMLDPNIWWDPSNTARTASVFFIDPLGYNNIGGTLAGTSRITLSYPGSGTLTAAQAQSIFMWQDELTYVMPKDMTSGTAPTNGTRPMPIVDSSNNQQVDGKFSWFLTVSPSTTELNLYSHSASPQNCWPQTYSVAAVVCNRRDFSSAGEIVLSGGSCDNAIGYGGVGFTYAGTTTLKSGQWALLYTNNPSLPSQCTWYRAVGVGFDGTNTRMTLLGPDWYGHGSGGGDGTASLLVISSVTGVYTTTVKLDKDETWSK